MATKQHTPIKTPVTVRLKYDGGRECEIIDAAGDFLCYIPNKEYANAIRDALNSHEALLAAIKAFLSDQTISDTLESMLNRDMAFAEEVPQYAADCQAMEDVVMPLRAAIAKAEAN